jgi:hypothetical protein
MAPSEDAARRRARIFADTPTPALRRVIERLKALPDPSPIEMQALTWLVDEVVWREMAVQMAAAAGRDDPVGAGFLDHLRRHAGT